MATPNVGGDYAGEIAHVKPSALWSSWRVVRLRMEGCAHSGKRPRLSSSHRHPSAVADGRKDLPTSPHGDRYAPLAGPLDLEASPALD